MPKPYPLKILLVDDDGNIRRTLALLLKDFACQADSATSVEEALAAIKAQEYDLILTDYKMERQTGLDLIRQVMPIHPGQTIVVMTAFASFDNAVEVIRAGAFDYLPKPFTNGQLEHLLTKVRQIALLKHENRDLKKSLKDQRCRVGFFSGFTSVASKSLEDFVNQVAPTEATILLTGESGTGKSELARFIHSHSPRADKPFVTVYCTTLTESLLESELFGHRKGSFTGAVQDKIGKLELADGGTLFLDEIGDLSPNGQAKLLRFLQEKVFERVGSNDEIKVDARIIAATNKNLEEAVSAGRFREDLFYRLNVMEYNLVSLRHRREDLPVFIEKFLQELSPNKKITIPDEVREVFEKSSWPGNLRQLRNVIERLVMLASGKEIRVEDLPKSIAAPVGSGSLGTLEELEREHIARVLEGENNQEKAAKMLGITTVTLWRKRKEYGLR